MIRRAAMAVLVTLCLAACQTTVQEDPVNTETGQLCDAFDVTGVDGLIVPDAAETQAVAGAFLDGYGRCTVRLDGGRALALEVDHADSQAAQGALADEQWKSADLSVEDATGFIGRTGPADDDGGRAVLGNDARVVRVTVEQSLVADGAEADRVAGDVARVVLHTLSAQDR